MPQYICTSVYMDFEVFYIYSEGVSLYMYFSIYGFRTFECRIIYCKSCICRSRNAFMYHLNADNAFFSPAAQKMKIHHNKHCSYYVLQCMCYLIWEKIVRFQYICTSVYMDFWEAIRPVSLYMDPYILRHNCMQLDLPYGIWFWSQKMPCQAFYKCRTCGNCTWKSLWNDLAL